MGKKIGYLLQVLLAMVTLQSCVEDLDFDQFDDLQIEPVIEGSILYVEAPEDIINRAIASNFYSQDFNFDGFSDAFFADRVIDGVVTYLVENTTSKDLNISVDFVDEAGNVLDVEFFNVPAAPPMQQILREIPYGGTGNSLDILINTSAIRVTAENNGDTSSTSDISDAKVTIKSSGKFRLSVK
ncbi:hypothetical protein [Aurantibacter sp.]|uniref:hypothetical protein n=1 Tax=Aurantibacter sp. TaxID=2807103 RepID=UPI003263FB11